MGYALSILSPPGGMGQGEQPRALIEVVSSGLDGAGGVLPDGDGAVWSFGQTKIALRPVKIGAGREEIHVSIPFGAPLDEVEEAVRELLTSATSRGLSVFDPQIGRAVSGADAATVSSRFAEASDYHLRFSGVSEDPRHGMPAASGSQPALVSPKVKFMGGALLVLLALYMLFRLLVINPVMDALSPGGAAGLERPPGPPPGWLERHPPPSPVDPD